MQKLEVSEMESLEGGRPFIGNGTVSEVLANGCTRTCQQNYFFWVPTGGHYACSEWTCPNSGGF